MYYNNKDFKDYLVPVDHNNNCTHGDGHLFSC